MSTSKYTPGPWAIVPRIAPKGLLMIESEHGLVACMEHSKTRPITYEKAEANAILIAAAPDLLSTLQNTRVALINALIIGMADMPISEAKIEAKKDASVALIDAAIAKATGDAA